MRNVRYALPALVLLVAAPPAQSACYGPVGERDTLWLIALELRPEPSVSPQRMMLALLEANPAAFGSPNVNALKAGSTVCFDASKAIELDDLSAVAEVRRHNREWQSARLAARAGAATAEMPTVPAGANPSGADSPRTEAGLPARNGQPESGSLDLAQSVAVFELRLATMEESLEQLGTGGPSSRVMPDPELASTVDELGGRLERLLPRLERLEQAVERLRAEVTQAGIRNELAALRLRLSALEAADTNDGPVPTGPSAALPADSESESRLGENLARLGLRVAHNEERIRVLVGLLDAESEAIEVLNSRLLRSLRLISSASVPYETFREPEPSGAVETDRGAGSALAPMDEGAGMTEPSPALAPRDGSSGAMKPTPPPAPRDERAGTLEPSPAPAPHDGDAGVADPSALPVAGSRATEPNPPPTPPSGGVRAVEPKPKPPPVVGSGAMEPNPTPAPRDERAVTTEPGPKPAPPGTDQAAGTTQRQPNPVEEDGEPRPVATPEPAYMRYVTVVTDHVSEWMTRLRDLW